MTARDSWGLAEWADTGSFTLIGWIDSLTVVTLNDGSLPRVEGESARVRKGPRVQWCEAVRERNRLQFDARPRLVGRPPAADRLRRGILRFAQHDGARVAGSVRYRLAQAWSQITTRDPAVIVPPELAALIAEDITPAFNRLSAADRAHLVAVGQSLADAGWDDGVVAAGLLHDIGKSVPGVRLTVVDRGAWVVLKRVWPSAALRLASCTTRPAAGAGIWALARHAETGAAMLAGAGYDDRVCWLVRHHERTDIDDSSLRALMAADESRCPPGLATR